jgi:hypothetical protein
MPDPNGGSDYVLVHTDDGEAITDGAGWGSHISSSVPGYVQDPNGPGISPGVHMLKGNGPQ